MINEELNLINNRIRMKKEQMAREKIEIPEEKELVKETIKEKMDESLEDFLPDMDFSQSEEKKMPFPAELYAENTIAEKDII